MVKQIFFNLIHLGCTAGMSRFCADDENDYHVHAGSQCVTKIRPKSFSIQKLLKTRLSNTVNFRNFINC